LTGVQAARPDLTFVLPDMPGGVFTYTAGIVAAADRRCIAVRTHARRSTAPRSTDSTGADTEIIFEHDLPFENLYSAMRRLHRHLAGYPGVVIANDWIELATCATYDSSSAVVTVTHGDSPYYYDLAQTYERTVDAFITVSRRGAEELRGRLPHRASDIHHVRTGVALDAHTRAPSDGRLRIMYAGRFDAAKRVADLPHIARMLHERGVDAAWTLFGDGPLRAETTAAWPIGVDVYFAGQVPVETVRAAYAHHDAFVLASSAEGLPITLLECGAAGVVPIVTDIPSGMPEVVERGVTGMLCPVGDVDAFACALSSLASNRRLLETMSAAVRERVASRFDINRTAAEFVAVLDASVQRRRERGWQRTGPYAGSRLDQRWLPNALVRAVRRRIGR
jgi:glycosyltransferase involved in cell wall biosynthesis